MHATLVTRHLVRPLHGKRGHSGSRAARVAMDRSTVRYAGSLRVQSEFYGSRFGRTPNRCATGTI